MKLAEGIHKYGFRKWYERQLLQSHAHLALTFLCLIGIFAAFEGLTRFRSWGDQAFDLASILLSAATGLWALRRHLYLLSSAEATANQAACPQCQAYGRLQLMQASPDGERARVRCRACAHEWEIGL